MKILIFYASYGGGHFSAAKSIKEYIDNNFLEADAKLIDCMKYVNKPIEKITTKAYNSMAKNAPWVWGKIYADSQKGPLAHISSKSNTIFAIKLLKLLKKEQPDLIISTHPFSSQMCSYLKRKEKIDCPIATIMTDFAPHDQWLIGWENTDYFFVAHKKMREDLIAKGIPNEKIFATGIPISSKFSKHYNKYEILNNFNFDNHKKTILFFAGGTFGLGKSRTIDIFKCLINDFKDLQILAISGKNVKMYEELREIVAEANKSDLVKVFEFVDNVPELMSISDMVITKPGGLTATESLVSGLPMIIINPIPGQEIENAKFIRNSGAGIWLKRKMDIKKTISQIINNESKLTNMRLHTTDISNKFSTKDICEILLKNN